MVKKCGKCKYGGDEYLCRVWGLLKSQVRLKCCSEKLGDIIIKETGITATYPDGVRSVILYHKFNEIGRDLFGVDWVDTSVV
jgi:hypothetical protein